MYLTLFFVSLIVYSKLINFPQILQYNNYKINIYYMAINFFFAVGPDCFQVVITYILYIYADTKKNEINNWKWNIE